MTDVRVVAEIGQAKGDPSYVAKAIEVCAAVGVWGVKVQLLQPERIAAAGAAPYWQEERPDIPDQRANFARTGCLPYDADVLADLVLMARRAGVELFASPFDREAVGVMARAGMRWCKLASGDLTNEELVRRAAAQFPGRLIMATGAAEYQQVERAVRWVEEYGKGPAYLLACSLAYPTPDEHAEIARVGTLRRNWPYAVGYSDHTHGTAAAAVAVGAGATLLEKHVTLDVTDPDVPDNAFALMPPELGYYVDAARDAAAMLGMGVLTPTDVELPARAGAYRSLYATRDLPAGHRVGPGDVDALRPVVPGCFGADERMRFFGQVLELPVAAGHAIPRAAVVDSAP